MSHHVMRECHTCHRSRQLLRFPGIVERHVVLAQLPVQRHPGPAELLRGPAFVPVAGSECRHTLAFRIVSRSQQAIELWRQFLECHKTAMARGEQGLDEVSQLADIAGPTGPAHSRSTVSAANRRSCLYTVVKCEA